MNFYTTAARINKKIDDIVRQNRDAGTDFDEESLRATLMKSEMVTAKSNMVLGVQLMAMYKEVCAELGVCPVSRCYFVTIRPDTTKITFDAFFAVMEQLMRRKCFTSYQLSFEQKGTSDADLGAGFHVHFVAQCTQRSKGELLRDIFSSVKHCTAYQCVDVAVCKNPDVHVKRYLLDYDSSDGHKIVTKDWDILWREKLGLNNLYENELRRA